MSPRTKACPLCGEKNNRVAIRCKHCKSTLPEAADSVPELEVPRVETAPEGAGHQATGDKYFWLAIALAILLCGASGYFFWSMRTELNAAEEALSSQTALRISGEALAEKKAEELDVLRGSQTKHEAARAEADASSREAKEAREMAEQGATAAKAVLAEAEAGIKEERITLQRQESELQQLLDSIK